MSNINTTTVEYRPIPGFPMYRVSNTGEVWSRHKHFRVNKIRDGEWGMLSPSDNGNGYLHVVLHSKRKPTTFHVHRIVLHAFTGPCPKNQEACHNNGIRKDNRLGNLRWDTHASNMSDCIAHGTTAQTHARGTACSSAKLTEPNVREIRRRYAAGGITQVKLAEEFNVQTMTVCSLILRRTWKHVE